MPEAMFGNRPTFYTPAPMVALHYPSAADETAHRRSSPRFSPALATCKNLTGL